MRMGKAEDRCNPDAILKVNLSPDSLSELTYLNKIG